MAPLALSAEQKAQIVQNVLARLPGGKKQQQQQQRAYVEAHKEALFASLANEDDVKTNSGGHLNNARVPSEDKALLAWCKGAMTLATVFAPAETHVMVAGVLKNAEDIAARLKLAPVDVLQLLQAFSTSTAPAVMLFLMTLSVRSVHAVVEIVVASSQGASSKQQHQHHQQLQANIATLWTMLAAFRQMHGLLHRPLDNTEVEQHDHCVAALLAMYFSTQIAYHNASPAGTTTTAEQLPSVSYAQVMLFASAGGKWTVLREALLQEFAVQQLSKLTAAAAAASVLDVLVFLAVYVHGESIRDHRGSLQKSVAQVQLAAWVQRLVAKGVSGPATPLAIDHIPQEHLVWMLDAIKEEEEQEQEDDNDDDEIDLNKLLGASAETLDGLFDKAADYTMPPSAKRRKVSATEEGDDDDDDEDEDGEEDVANDDDDDEDEDEEEVE